MSHVVIYALLDDAGTIRYVGKTVNPKSRLSEHRRVRKWISKLIIIEWVDGNEWVKAERFWIDFYKPSGLLENKYDGGTKGPLGIKMTKEAIARAVAARKAKSGWKLSDSHRLALLNSITNRPVSQSTRQKISNSHKGMRATEETKAKLRAAWIVRKASGWKFSTESLSKIAEASRNRITLDSTREKLRIMALKKGPKTAEVKAKISASVKLRWSLGVYKERNVNKCHTSQQ